MVYFRKEIPIGFIFKVYINRVYLRKNIETGRCFITRLSEHKHDLKLINMAKLKEDEMNKKTILIKHCFKYEQGIDFVNFQILNFNICSVRIPSRNTIRTSFSGFLLTAKIIN